MVIASHYAQGVTRTLIQGTPLRAAPDPDADILVMLETGDSVEVLDDSRGWAWGYAGPDRRVGYLPSSALGD